MKQFKIDQVWFDAETKQIVGDLYYSSQISDETITDDLQGLMAELNGTLKALYQEDESNGTDDVRIIEIQSAEMNEEEYRPKDGWNTNTAIAVCTKDYADSVGLPQVMEQYYDNYAFIDDYVK